MTRLGGRTQAFPKGMIEHGVLKAAAIMQFRTYRRQRPQCRFATPEIVVEEDLTHNLESARWDVESEIIWS